MPDACQIGTEAEAGKRDETTGKKTTTFTEVYNGPCQFKAGNTAAGDTEAAGQRITEQSATLKLPVATSGMVRTDMVVIMTASEDDPALVGTRARIKGVFPASGTTTRRLPIEVVS